MFKKIDLRAATLFLAMALFIASAVITWGNDRIMALSFALLGAVFALQTLTSAEPRDHTKIITNLSAIRIVLTIVAGALLLVSFFQ